MRESESCANITVSGTDRRVCQIDSDQQRTGTERADPRQGKGKGRAGEEGTGVRRVVVTSPEAAEATVDLEAAVGACGGSE